MRPEYESIEGISEGESGRRVARGCGIGSLVVRDVCVRTHSEEATTDRRGPSLQIDRYAAEFRITALDRHIRDRTVFITFIGEEARSSGGMQPCIVGDALS